MPATIMVVDDHEDSRELLAVALSCVGFEVMSYETAEDALEAACSSAPALVVTDLTLEAMSGYELAARLRANEVTTLVPVIAVSGRSPESSRDAALFREIFVKPLNPGALVEAVQRTLASTD
jgi:two-component system phosphate regulon response regulator PhoB